MSKKVVFAGVILICLCDIMKFQIEVYWLKIILWEIIYEI